MSGLPFTLLSESPTSGTALFWKRMMSFMLVAPMSLRNSGVSTEIAAAVFLSSVLRRLPARVFCAR